MKRFKIFSPILFVFLLCFIYFWPLLAHPDKIVHGDDFRISYYLKKYIAQEIQNGRVPLWNPLDRTGFPLFANPGSGLWYPFNLLFLILPVYLAFNISIVIHVAITFLFTFAFAKSLKLFQIPAFTAATAFAFAGFLPLRIYTGHLEIIESVAWIPAVFFFLHQYFRTTDRKYLIFGAFSLAMQILAGYPAVFVYTLEALFLFVLFYPKNTLFLRMRTLFFTVLLGMGLSCIQLIPSVELLSQITRNNNMSYAQGTFGSFPPSHLFNMILPLIYGNPFLKSFPGPGLFWELGFYGGVITFFLFVRSFSTLKKDAYLSCSFFLIAILMVFIALGSYNPLYKILYEVSSFYRNTRVPSRQLFLFAFSFAMLAGIGSQLLKKKWLQIFCLLVLIADLFLYGRKFIRMDNPAIYQGDPQLFSALDRDKSLYRVYPVFNIFSFLRISVSEFQTPWFYQIASVKSYDPYILKSYHDFTNRIEGNISYGEIEAPLTNTTSPLLDFLNAKYFLTGRDANPDKDNPKRFKKLIDDPGYKLFENMDVKPRFFLTPEDLTSSPLGTGIEVVKYLPNEIVFRVSTEKDALLSSSELYYPGWKAQLDGKSVNFQLIENTFRGTKIPAGIHTLRWFFLPNSFLAGASVTLLTLVFCLFSLRQPKQLKPLK